MTPAELGALGEFVGGIAVILTVVYLTIQIRQNTSQLREYSPISRLLLQEIFVSGQETFFRSILENEEVHRVWRLGTMATDEVADAEGRERFGFVLYGQMYRYHVMFQARAVEPLEHERCLIQAARMAAMPAFRSWRTRHRRSFVFDAEFVDLVDSRIEKQGTESEI